MHTYIYKPPPPTHTYIHLYGVVRCVGVSVKEHDVEQ